MKTFIEIFNGKDGSQVANKVNIFAQEQGLEIVNATSFMWQGVIYTTVVFKENVIEKVGKSLFATAEVTKIARAKRVKECENG